MNTSMTQKGYLGVAVLLAVLYIAVGVSAFFGEGREKDVRDYGRLGASMIGFIPAGIIVVGLWIKRRSPMLGGILVLVGAVPLAIAMFWTIFMPVLALLMVVFWVAARRSAKEGYIT